MDNLQSKYADQPLVFGPFTLRRTHKLLLDGARPVKLGGRAFDILVALVERAGDVVSKQQLVDCVWPNTFVEESSLRVHISALRKALGEGQNGARYIANVAGRGYCFVATVERPTSFSASATSSSPHNLPARVTRLVGRDENLQALAYMLPMKRFLTIAGGGGMGKTTLALALGEQLSNSYPDGVRFVDLGVLAEASQIFAPIGTALGLSLGEGDQTATLLRHLRDKRMLLLFDNCDRVVDAVADVIAPLLRGAAHLHVLTTCREPLLTPGECVHRLGRLSVPDAPHGLTVVAAMSHASVQLFVERAIAAIDTFELTDSNVDDVCNLCRQLDGLPLAIELAAAQIADFGLHGLKLQFEDRLTLLDAAQRTAPPRHRSLRSMLDWSFETLSDVEQRVLARVSVFRGSFPLEAALAVSADNTITKEAAARAVGVLSGKSLLTTQASDHEVTYRYPDTTRAYAYSKLSDIGELRLAHRLHAEYLCTLLDSSPREQAAMQAREWRSIYGATADDVRTALDWAYSSPGDELLGVRLTAAAIPLGFQLAKLDETHRDIKVALRHLRDGGFNEPILEMRLCELIGFLISQTQDPREDMGASSERAQELSQKMTQIEPHLQAINGLWLDAFARGDYPASLQNAEAMERLARTASDPLALLVADRLRAQSLHYVGEHDAAIKLAERVLRHPGKVLRLSMSAGTPLDRRVSMRILLARMSWLKGFPDQAAEIAEEAVELAECDVPHALCQALAYAACPIALWRGDLNAAALFSERLATHCGRINSIYYGSWAINFDTAVRAGRCMRRSSTKPVAEITLSASADTWQKDMFATISADFLTKEAIDRRRNGIAGWSAPELARVEGLLVSSTNIEEGAGILIRAKHLAEAQKALAWELRAATSIALLWKDDALHKADAYADLERVYERFREGASTTDVSWARQVLET